MNKYITKDEYLQNKGINLELELKDDDNHSKKTERFIHEVTDWCILHLISEYDCNNDLLAFQTISEWRQKYFRDGVMDQMEYIINNGWITKDSGINKATGSIMDYSRVVLSPNAKLNFKMGAFANIKTY